MSYNDRSWWVFFLYFNFVVGKNPYTKECTLNKNTLQMGVKLADTEGGIEGGWIQIT